MLKQYRTIREVVGPLMLVDQVENVKYDELVEIEQADGEVRRGKVLEVDGDRALVQLFESSHGLKTVSYTHLDVYKRQSQARGAGPNIHAFLVNRRMTTWMCSGVWFSR